MEKFGWKFSAKEYSSPEDGGLSSAAMVTAAKTVQRSRQRSVARAALIERCIGIVTEFSFAPLPRPDCCLTRTTHGLRCGLQLFRCFAAGVAWGSTFAIKRWSLLDERGWRLVGTGWVIYTYSLP